MYSSLDNDTLAQKVQNANDSKTNESGMDELCKRGVIAPLLAWLKTEGKEYYAIRALGDNREVRAVEPLIELLSAHWQKGRQAAEALGEIGDLRAVEPLIECLSNDKMRAQAVIALGKLGDPRAVEPLIDLFARRHEDKKRPPYTDPVMCPGEVVIALGRIGDARCVRFLETVGLEDVDHYIRQRTVEAFGFVSPSDAIGPLQKALRGDGLRLAAATALAKLESDQAVDILASVLGDDEREVREEAVKGLARISSPAANMRLREALYDRAFSVRVLAAAALYSTGDDHAREILTGGLMSKKPKERVSTLRSLYELGVELEPELEVETLLSVLLDAPRYATMAATRLGKIRDPRAIEALVEAYAVLCAPSALSDGSERWAVLRALGESGDERALKPLAKILNEGRGEQAGRYPSGDEREAAMALVLLGDNGIMALVELLRHERKHIRVAAAEALFAAAERNLSSVAGHWRTIVSRCKQRRKHEDNACVICGNVAHWDKGGGIEIPAHLQQPCLRSWLPVFFRWRKD